MKYYMLKQTDIIANGDEIKSCWGTWNEVLPEDVGRRKKSLYSHFDKIRRRVKGKNEAV